MTPTGASRSKSGKDLSGIGDKRRNKGRSKRGGGTSTRKPTRSALSDDREAALADTVSAVQSVEQSRLLS